MQSLNLPAFNYKLQRSKTGYDIFDVVRRKYVRLTPEEWVRQHFLHYLVDHLAYPKTLVRMERVLLHPKLRCRPDMVVYNRFTQPTMLVECKAPSIDINTYKVWQQVGRYNAHCSVQLLVITNGLVHFCWRLDYAQGKHTLLYKIPYFHQLFAHAPYVSVAR